MKALISQKNINEYNFTDVIAYDYIKALQLLNADKEITEELERSLSSAGLYKDGKLRVFNYKKSRTKKQVVDNDIEFDRDKFLKSLMIGKHKLKKIIGLYLYLLNTQMQTYSIANSVVVRHLRDAKALEPWLETEETKNILKKCMVDTFEESQKLGYTMTLGTVYKKLTK